MSYLYRGWVRLQEYLQGHPTGQFSLKEMIIFPFLGVLISQTSDGFGLPENVDPYQLIEKYNSYYWLCGGSNMIKNIRRHKRILIKDIKLKLYPVEIIIENETNLDENLSFILYFQNEDEFTLASAKLIYLKSQLNYIKVCQSTDNLPSTLLHNLLFSSLYNTNKLSDSTDHEDILLNKFVNSLSSSPSSSTKIIIKDSSTYLTKKLFYDTLSILNFNLTNKLLSSCVSYYKLVKPFGTSITSLILNNCNLNDKIVGTLNNLINCCPYLRNLNLNDNFLTSHGLLQILQNLSNSPLSLRNIETLSFSSNLIDDSCMSSISKLLILFVNNNLLHLNLSRNRLTLASGKDLIESLGSFQNKLKSLNLSYNELSDSISPLFSILLCNIPNTLEVLDLSYIGLKEEGINLICKHLLLCENLKFLNLQGLFVNEFNFRLLILTVSQFQKKYPLNNLKVLFGGLIIDNISLLTLPLRILKLGFSELSEKSNLSLIRLYRKPSFGLPILCLRVFIPNFLSNVNDLLQYIVDSMNSYYNKINNSKKKIEMDRFKLLSMSFSQQEDENDQILASSFSSYNISNFISSCSTIPYSTPSSSISGLKSSLKTSEVTTKSNNLIPKTSIIQNSSASFTHRSCFLLFQVQNHNLYNKIEQIKEDFKSRSPLKEEKKKFEYDKQELETLSDPSAYDLCQTLLTIARNNKRNSTLKILGIRSIFCQLSPDEPPQMVSIRHMESILNKEDLPTISIINRYNKDRIKIEDENSDEDETESDARKRKFNSFLGFQDVSNITSSTFNLTDWLPETEEKINKSGSRSPLNEISFFNSNSSNLIIENSEDENNDYEIFYDDALETWIQKENLNKERRLTNEKLILSVRMLYKNKEISKKVSQFWEGLLGNKKYKSFTQIEMIFSMTKLIFNLKNNKDNDNESIKSNNNSVITPKNINSSSNNSIKSEKQVYNKLIANNYGPINPIFPSIWLRELTYEAIYSRDIEALSDAPQGEIGGAAGRMAERIRNEIIALKTQWVHINPLILSTIQSIESNNPNTYSLEISSPGTALSLIEEFLLECARLVYTGEEMQLAIRFRKILAREAISSGEISSASIELKAILTNLIISRDYEKLINKVQSLDENLINLCRTTYEVSKNVINDYYLCLNTIEKAINSKEIKELDEALALASYHYFYTSYSSTSSTSLVEQALQVLEGESRNPALLVKPIIEGLREDNIEKIEEGFNELIKMGIKYEGFNTIICNKIIENKKIISKEDKLKEKLIKISLGLKNKFKYNNNNEIMLLYQQCLANKLNENSITRPYFLILEKYCKSIQGSRRLENGREIVKSENGNISFNYLLKHEKIIQQIIIKNDIHNLIKLLIGRGNGKLIMSFPSAFSRDEWFLKLQAACDGYYAHPAIVACSQGRQYDDKVRSEHDKDEDIEKNKNKIIFKGTFEKAARTETGELKSWRRRFFQLTPITLSYYTRESNGELKGSIRVLNGKVRVMETKETNFYKLYCLELTEGRDLSTINQDLLEEARKIVKDAKIKEIEKYLSVGIKLKSINLLTKMFNFMKDLEIMLDSSLVNKAKECLTKLKEENIKKDLYIYSTNLPSKMKINELLMFIDELKINKNLLTIKNLTFLNMKNDIDYDIIRLKNHLLNKNYNMLFTKIKLIIKNNYYNYNIKQKSNFLGLIIQYIGYFFNYYKSLGISPSYLITILKECLNYCSKFHIEIESMDLIRFIININENLSNLNNNKILGNLLLKFNMFNETNNKMNPNLLDFLNETLFFSSSKSRYSLIKYSLLRNSNQDNNNHNSNSSNKSNSFLTLNKKTIKNIYKKNFSYNNNLTLSSELLTFSKFPLTKPLLLINTNSNLGSIVNLYTSENNGEVEGEKSSSSYNLICIECFTILQIIMNDLPFSYINSIKKSKVITKKLNISHLILDLLEYGNKKNKTIRDELYFQLCKQLNNNENFYSYFNGWILFSLYLHCFLPSLSAFFYIQNFIFEQEEQYNFLLSNIKSELNSFSHLEQYKINHFNDNILNNSYDLNNNLNAFINNSSSSIFSRFFRGAGGVAGASPTSPTSPISPSQNGLSSPSSNTSFFHSPSSPSSYMKFTSFFGNSNFNSSTTANLGSNSALSSSKNKYTEQELLEMYNEYHSRKHVLNLILYCKFLFLNIENKLNSSTSSLSDISLPLSNREPWHQDLVEILLKNQKIPLKLVTISGKKFQDEFLFGKIFSPYKMFELLYEKLLPYELQGLISLNKEKFLHLYDAGDNIKLINEYEKELKASNSSITNSSSSLLSDNYDNLLESNKEELILNLFKGFAIFPYKSSIELSNIPRENGNENGFIETERFNLQEIPIQPSCMEKIDFSYDIQWDLLVSYAKYIRKEDQTEEKVHPLALNSYIIRYFLVNSSFNFTDSFLLFGDEFPTLDINKKNEGWKKWLSNTVTATEEENKVKEDTTVKNEKIDDHSSDYRRKRPAPIVPPTPDSAISSLHAELSSLPSVLPQDSLILDLIYAEDTRLVNSRVALLSPLNFHYLLAMQIAISWVVFSIPFEVIAENNWETSEWEKKIREGCKSTCSSSDLINEINFFDYTSYNVSLHSCYTNYSSLNSWRIIYDKTKEIYDKYNKHDEAKDQDANFSNSIDEISEENDDKNSDNSDNEAVQRPAYLISHYDNFNLDNSFYFDEDSSQGEEEIDDQYEFVEIEEEIDDEDDKTVTTTSFSLNLDEIEDSKRKIKRTVRKKVRKDKYSKWIPSLVYHDSPITNNDLKFLFLLLDQLGIEYEKIEGEREISNLLHTINSTIKSNNKNILSSINNNSFSNNYSINFSLLWYFIGQFHKILLDINEKDCLLPNYRYLMKRSYHDYLATSCPFYGSFFINSRIKSIDFYEINENNTNTSSDNYLTKKPSKYSKIQDNTNEDDLDEEDQVKAKLSPAQSAALKASKAANASGYELNECKKWQEKEILFCLTTSGVYFLDVDQWSVLFYSSYWDLQLIEIDGENNYLNNINSRFSLVVNGLKISIESQQILEILNLLNNFSINTLSSGNFLYGTLNNEELFFNNNDEKLLKNFNFLIIRNYQHKNYQKFLSFYSILITPPAIDYSLLNSHDNFIVIPESQREILARERYEEEKLEKQMEKLAQASLLEKNQHQMTQGRDEVMKSIQVKDNNEDFDNTENKQSTFSSLTSSKSLSRSKSKRRNRSVMSFVSAEGDEEISLLPPIDNVTGIVCGISPRENYSKKFSVPQLPSFINGKVNVPLRSKQSNENENNNSNEIKTYSIKKVPVVPSANDYLPISYNLEWETTPGNILTTHDEEDEELIELANTLKEIDLTPLVSDLQTPIHYIAEYKDDDSLFKTKNDELNPDDLLVDESYTKRDPYLYGISYYYSQSRRNFSLNSNN